MNEQQLAAVKQALEAFSVLSMNDYSGYECSKHETDKIDAAITALQSIISQDALDKMADNARELGLDYEPVTWRNAAIRVGEDLCSVGPFGYYEMSAEQWLDWALSVVTVHAPPAQPAVQEGRDWSLLAATQESLREHMAEIKRLKAAQNPWVNLTDEEMKDLWAIHSGPPLYRAIEAKLKEKNT
jgi:hypothetical protein